MLGLQQLAGWAVWGELELLWSGQDRLLVQCLEQLGELDFFFVWTTKWTCALSRKKLINSHSQQPAVAQSAQLDWKLIYKYRETPSLKNDLLFIGGTINQHKVCIWLLLSLDKLQRPFPLIQAGQLWITDLRVKWTDARVMSKCTQDSQKVCTKLLSLPDNARKLNF